jgi:hypothetical protein
VSDADRLNHSASLDWKFTAAVFVFKAAVLHEDSS